MDIKYMLKSKDLVEVILEYYKSEIDTYYVTSTKYEILWWINTIIYFASGIAIASIYFIRNFSFWKTILLVACVLIIITFCLFFQLLKSRRKYRNKLLEKMYNIRVKDYKKVHKIGSEVQMYRLESFLKNYIFNKSNNRDNKEKIIEALITKIEEKTHTKIVTKLFIPGIFAVIFIPAWNEFTTIVFKGTDTVSASPIIITYFLIGVSISFLFGILKFIGQDIISTFESKEKLIMKDVLSIIKYIKFRLLYED